MRVGQAQPTHKELSPVPVTILYTDSRASNLDIEQSVSGSDAVLLNPQKKTFDEIDIESWQSADGIITARMPIGPDAIPHLKRTRVVVRHGVGFDIIDLEACG